MKEREDPPLYYLRNGKNPLPKDTRLIKCFISDDESIVNLLLESDSFEAVIKPPTLSAPKMEMVVVS
ncbi:hypothetical protein LCGC14_0938860 [marine sediment metagenome]|uniref:Uncharacterized protein n=1 Tax=marine sediment metagenome TaxID=412755 RepID=A0A0F9RS04_9ZZZZ